MVKAIFLGLFFIFGANHSEISSDGDTSSLIGVWKVTKVKLRKISTTDSDGIANLSRKEVIITSDSINFESLSIHEKIISIQADSIILDQELADKLNIKKSKLPQITMNCDNVIDRGVVFIKENKMILEVDGIIFVCKKKRK